MMVIPKTVVRTKLDINGFIGIDWFIVA